eukprot:3657844-Pleurochrysis_carterae.AAC.3
MYRSAGCALTPPLSSDSVGCKWLVWLPLQSGWRASRAPRGAHVMACLPGAPAHGRLPTPPDCFVATLNEYAT